MWPERSILLVVVAVLLVMVGIEATTWLPAFDRAQLDARHRATCRENLNDWFNDPFSTPRSCPADAYAALRPSTASPYPLAVDRTGGLLAHCPRHEPGLLVLDYGGVVELLTWEELGVRDRTTMVLVVDGRDPRLSALGYQ